MKSCARWGVLKRRESQGSRFPRARDLDSFSRDLPARLTHLALHACQRIETCITLLPFAGTYAYLADLSSELNIPTWFATLTLALTALSLAVAGLAEQRGTRDRVMWWALCAIFLYLSLDEATDLHGIWIEATPGLTLLDAPSGFDWVIPGAFVVFAVGALFIRWVLRLPRRTRNFFMLAGALYVTGGLLFEIAGAVVADETFLRPSYILIATVEEALEMLGVH